MGSSRRILLEGFEAALVDAIAAATAAAPPEFRFSDPSFSNLVLQGGRHLFVNDLPEVEDLLQTSADFDEHSEPSIAVFTQTGTGPKPSASSGAVMETVLRIVLRFGTVPEIAKQFLEQLAKFIHEDLKGARMGGFILKNAEFMQRPSVFQRQADDHAFVSTTMRFWAVARPFAST